MTDESPLARALRIAMQNHVTAYGGRNALDQGDYGYGTPVTYSDPNPLSSSGLQHQGPWMRQYMPSTMADLLSQILTYAPMAVPAMRGRVMEGGLRPQDFATAPAMERNAIANNPRNYGPDVMGGSQKHSMNAEGLSDMRGISDPQHWHNYGMHPADMLPHRAPRPSNLNTIPEEATFNINAPLTADEISTLLRLQGRKPFETIPGGKE